MASFKSVALPLAFVTVGSAIAYRTLSGLETQDTATFAYWGLQDFRISIYYPVQVFLQGGNPYDVVQFRQIYPQVAPFGLYSPVTLLLHVPFGLLSPHHADIADFFVNLALVPVLAALGLWLCRIKLNSANVFGTATLILLSRPGQSCLHLGQSAIFIVIAVYVALGWARTRPWVAGLALAVVSIKATFAVPLAFLLFWRRDYRALLSGAAIAGVLTAAVLPLLVHAAGGLGPFWHSLLTNYRDFRADPSFDPVYSPFRMDTAGFVGRLLRNSLGTPGDMAVMISVLGVAAFCVRRLMVVQFESADRFAGNLICLAVLTCAYHQVYDTLVLVFPAVALASGRWLPPDGEPRPALRLLLLGLILFPAFNYLSASTVLEHLGINGTGWILLTSANGAALLGAFLVHAVLTCWTPAVGFTRDRSVIQAAASR